MKCNECSACHKVTYNRRTRNGTAALGGQNLKDMLSLVKVRGLTFTMRMGLSLLMLAMLIVVSVM